MSRRDGGGLLTEWRRSHGWARSRSRGRHLTGRRGGHRPSDQSGTRNSRGDLRALRDIRASGSDRSDRDRTGGCALRRGRRVGAGLTRRRSRPRGSAGRRPRRGPGGSGRGSGRSWRRWS